MSEHRFPSGWHAGRHAAGPRHALVEHAIPVRLDLADGVADEAGYTAVSEWIPASADAGQDRALQPQSGIGDAQTAQSAGVGLAGLAGRLPGRTQPCTAA